MDLGSKGQSCASYNLYCSTVNPHLHVVGPVITNEDTRPNIGGITISTLHIRGKYLTWPIAEDLCRWAGTQALRWHSHQGNRRLKANHPQFLK